VTCPYIPAAGNLPDSLDYTITAVFANGDEKTVVGSIDCRQSDISVGDMTLDQSGELWTLNAQVSNDGPFSIEGKTVTVGIYRDALGVNAVCREVTFDGSDFETPISGETFGSSVNAEFCFTDEDVTAGADVDTGTDADGLPILYIIARTYDQYGEIPDRAFENNVRSVSMPQDAPEEKPNISVDGRVVINLETWPDGDSAMFDPKFSLTAIEAIDLTLYTASYDSKGRLIRISSQSVSLRPGEKATVQAGIEKTDGAIYKFFIWDSAFRPLTGITSY
jgi:hypothetical protein